MKRGSIFELNGIPKFQEALPLALQHARMDTEGK